MFDRIGRILFKRKGGCRTKKQILHTTIFDFVGELMNACSFSWTDEDTLARLKSEGKEEAIYLAYTEKSGLRWVIHSDKVREQIKIDPWIIQDVSSEDFHNLVMWAYHCWAPDVMVG